MFSPLKQQIGSVFIPVKNVERARSWYCKLLGITDLPEIQFGHLCTLPGGIMLDEMPMWGGKEPGGAPTYQAPAFMFLADDIHQAYGFFREHGVTLVTEVQHDHWFAFRDPDGNVLMVCRAG